MNREYLILLLLNLLVQIICDDDCQEQGLSRFDDNVAKLLTIGEHSGRVFPNSTGQLLQQWCDQSQFYINEIDKYKTKCLGDMNKQVTGIFVYSYKHTILRRYCKKDKKKMTSFVEAANCLNNNDEIIARCYNRQIDSVMGAKNAQDKLKLLIYHEIFECFNANLTEAPGCNEKHVETLNELINSLTSKSFELICGDFSEDNDKCDHLGPPPMKKENETKWKSIAPAIFELLSSFPPA